MKFSQRHLFHLVDVSPWPIVGAFSALTLTLGFALYMHSFSFGSYIALLGLFLVLFTMFVWWRDVVREATYEGNHTSVVQIGIKYGVLVFIATEVMFFIAFFWGYFHASLSPVIEIGSIWPPKGITPFNPWEVPFLNTIILLLSGVTITWSHHAIIESNRKQAILGLELTVLLGAIFTALQVYEYIEAPFNISDGIYGTTFFMATGFHGAHVLIGSIFLFVCLIRLIKYHFTSTHHVGFEAAAWYWHFVDVVWLFLFTTVYWWGGA